MHNTPLLGYVTGPGVGKSTLAAETFAQLKFEGQNVELVREYAKDRVWLGDMATLAHQPYVTAKQIHRECMLDKKVDLIITDSPAIVGLLYPGDLQGDLLRAWESWIIAYFESRPYKLFYVTRTKPYLQKGRSQTKEQAEQVDIAAKAMMDRLGIRYEILPYEGRDTMATVYESARKWLNIEGPIGQDTDVVVAALERLAEREELIRRALDYYELR